MNKIITFGLVVMFIFVFGSVGAQIEKSSSPKDNASNSQATETIPLTGGHQLIVPKGATVKQVGSHTVIEDPTEIMLRHLDNIESRLSALEGSAEASKNNKEEIENRFLQLEATQQELQRIVAELKEALRNLQVSPPSPP
jgi:hypothetical protein